MSRSKKNFLFVFGLISLILLFSNVQFKYNYTSQNKNNYILKSSPNLEGAENILITDIQRDVNISGYGLVTINDRLTILNQNNNPINSIFISIPLNNSADLIFCKATGENMNSLLTERSNFILDDYEMIAIYFDSPLLAQQEKTIDFLHTHKNHLSFIYTGEQQNITITESIFPLLPYKAEGSSIKSIFRIPADSELGNYEKVDDLGFDITNTEVLYDLTQSNYFNRLDPFLGNFNKTQREVTIICQDTSFTKIEFKEITREIDISPWGIIKIKENYLLENLGPIDIDIIPLHIPYNSKNIHVYDDISDLYNTDLEDSTLFSNKKLFSIRFSRNRIPLKPSSKISFTLEYSLDINEFSSTNWFQESIQIDLLTTTFEFLGKDQVIKLIIEGCNDLEYISHQPDAIMDIRGSKILMYNSEFVSPIETKLILFTFSIDLFGLLFRPMIIALIIGILASLYVILFKIKKEKEDILIIEKKAIPIDEIREFCSLYEEKNALILEIRKAEEEAKRKKIAKKTYSNILDKNVSKIEQIKKESIPFKKILLETNETFQNIVKKLDILDAERESVNDSLSLLENRYKRGKLPSKAAYQKLLGDFMKRRKKIDKTIDKYIQQLRSYLL